MCFAKGYRGRVMWLLCAEAPGWLSSIVWLAQNMQILCMLHLQCGTELSMYGRRPTWGIIHPPSISSPPLLSLWLILIGLYLLTGNWPGTVSVNLLVEYSTSCVLMWLCCRREDGWELKGTAAHGCAHDVPTSALHENMNYAGYKTYTCMRRVRPFLLSQVNRDIIITKAWHRHDKRQETELWLTAAVLYSSQEWG